MPIQFKPKRSLWISPCPVPQTVCSSLPNQVLFRFLEFLKCIVSEPGSHFDELLPSIGRFCISKLYPSFLPDINVHPNIDTVNRFYEVILTFLSQKYQAILSEKIEGISISDLLIIVVSSLQSREIDTVKYTLMSLEKLNENHRFYQTDAFLKISDFVLRFLLSTLADKSHDLLADEIVRSIWNMSKSNANFSQTIFPQFIYRLTIENKESLIQQMSVVSDFPTFHLIFSQILRSIIHRS